MIEWRLSEVLRPLLAARGWAPWLIEPRRAGDRRTRKRLLFTAASETSWREHDRRRAPFDDVQ